MAQWLKALAGLLEDPGLAPSTHMVAHNCNSSARDPMPSSGLCGHCMLVMNIHMQSKILIHKIKINKISKNIKRQKSGGMLLIW
jgi:L-lactate utilization protein LutB